MSIIIKSSKIEQIKDAFDDIIFEGWRDHKEKAINDLLNGLEPTTNCYSSGDIMDELGEISNEFGEECNGSWNAAGERAGKQIGRLVNIIKKNFKVKK